MPFSADRRVCHADAVHRERAHGGVWTGLAGYGWSLATVALCTAVCAALPSSIEPTNLAMVYLLGVIFVASRFGRGQAVLAAFLGVAAFDLGFVPPRGLLTVADTQYLITFAAMLLVALTVSRLTLRLRTIAEASAERERRSAALYSLSRELARSRGKVEIAQAAAQEIAGVFEAEVAILTSGRVLAASPSGFEDEAVAQWTLDHVEAAGRGAAAFADSRGLYLPLRGGAGAVGVLAFLPNERLWPLSAAQRSLLETFANGLGIALERAQLAKESHEARLQAESERVRNALLSSISHDLRTPLTSIAGAASALVESGGGELAQTIYHESLRLNLQVQNLLDMTRLQSGEVRARFEWNSLEEIVGSALAQSRVLLGDRVARVEIAPDLPLMRLDADLIFKLFVNLMENAAHHTPPGSGLWIKARVETQIVRVIFADDGPGIAPGQEIAIFERFKQGGSKGAGLGLAICRAIMKLHQGLIWAQNRYGGGLEFHLEFPRSKDQPEVPVG